MPRNAAECTHPVTAQLVNPEHNACSLLESCHVHGSMHQPVHVCTHAAEGHHGWPVLDAC